MLCRQVSFFQTLKRSWVAEEGMDGFCLFLEFNKVGSGVRQVSCSWPATQDFDLCPTYMAYWADQARWIIKGSYRLVVFGAETPHIATLAKVLWTRGVEIMANLEI